MKIGDYVRTLDGIKKIKYYQYTPEREYCHCVHFENERCGWLLSNKELEKEINKISSNIIDLIEVGDYVNGELVNEVWKNLVLVGQESQPIPQKEIKSIVTKEQFKSMECRV